MKEKNSSVSNVRIAEYVGVFTTSGNLKQIAGDSLAVFQCKTLQFTSTCPSGVRTSNPKFNLPR